MGSLLRKPAGELRRLRELAGLTQQELADKAGVGVRTVRDLERGRVRRPHAESVQRLAAALGLPAGERDRLSPGGESGPLRIEVLGPVVVGRGSAAHGVGSGMQRTVLALLALQPGRAVSRDELIDMLWGEHPPRTACNLVHIYIGQIRRLLGPDSASVERCGGGYRLILDRERVDAARFDDLVAAARTARDGGDQGAARALYADALSRWHGPVAADANPRLHQHPAAVALGQRRIAAALEWADLAIDARCGGTVVPCLRALAQEQPLHEGVHTRLMLALADLGEQVGALQVFAELRDRLGRELGVQPGEEVRAAHVRVLRQRRAPEPVATPAAVPAQLPPDIATFTGRQAQLSALDSHLGRDDATVVCAVTGPAGVGKSALAVHWAHSAKHRFTDGQLYVNLRGFDPGGRVTAPAKALRAFLDALGVPPQRIPASLDAQTGLYRSLVAGRRMLIVLDNARDAEHVRPLLPGAPGCLVVVTSRSQLSGLVAADGAHPVPVDLMSRAEGRDLLARRLGPARIAAEPVAVAEAVARCAGLPLALVIVAARAATDRGSTLTALAAELRDANRRLDALAGTDPLTDVRGVFSWSYRNLSDPAARLFRLLGLHPGADISLSAAASLAGLPVPATRALLVELADAHLVAAGPGARYGVHDLLRAYAAELVAPSDAEALARVLDHYAHAACAAAVQLHPQRDPVVPAPPRAGVVVEEVTDAAAWLAAEQQVLLAAIERAVGAGLDAHAWQLAWALVDYLDMRGYWPDLIASQDAALSATRRLGDARGQAIVHRGLARGHTQLGRYDVAGAHLTRALELFEEIGDASGQGHVENSFAILAGRQGRDREALDHAQRALDLFRAAGHLPGQARAHNTVGWYHAQLGDRHSALHHCEQAVALHQQTGNRHGEGATWDSVGYAQHGLGEHARAIESYQRALDLLRDAGDRHLEATILDHLGQAHEALGDRPAAQSAWRRALAIFDALDHPDALAVRLRLT